MFLFISTVVTLERDFDEKGNITGLHVPTFIKDVSFSGYLSPFFVTIPTIIILLIAIVPIDKIRKYQPLIAAGFGNFYLVSHILSVIPNMPLIFLWLLGLIAGIGSGIISIQDLPRKIALSTGAAYVVSYLIMVFFEFGKLPFFISFFILVAIFVSGGLKFEKFHYPICRSLILTFISLVIVDNFIFFLRPFRALHNTTYILPDLKRLLAYLMIVIFITFYYFLTISEQQTLKIIGIRIKEKKEEKKEVEGK